MKRILTISILLFFFFFSNTSFAYAIEDPFSLPNNKAGVFILFTSELSAASNLVNSSGGSWGYVTIPIQIGDRDLEKWQKFMDDCLKFHIIPIIRLATESDYFNTSVWRKPSEDDIVDFANFLNSLNWPVKNKYIVIFNEVNRGDEWNGSSNPEEYANILSLAVDVFKSRSDDFFIISAGLDNAAPQAPDKYVNEYNFMNRMEESVPGIFSKIDGLGSHSYPNPGFSQAPWKVTNQSISSFKFEKNLVYNLSGKDLPIFITETGWSKNKLSENQIASYFEYAFESVWSDKDIIAVTPFLLKAGGEPFSQFSLLSENGDFNEISKTIRNIAKIKGEPHINLYSSSSLYQNSGEIPFKKFSKELQYGDPSDVRAQAIKPFLKWILKIYD